MKPFISLVALVCLFSTYSGGISVGSGQGKILVGLSLKAEFQEEESLIQKAQNLIAAINSGTSTRINGMKISGKCDFAYTRINELDVTAFYPVLKNEISLTKEYIGYLTVELKDCKNTDGIQADERFGWDELWE